MTFNKKTLNYRFPRWLTVISFVLFSAPFLIVFDIVEIQCADMAKKTKKDPKKNMGHKTTKPAPKQTTLPVKAKPQPQQLTAPK